MMEAAHIIFDLDGTLIDSRGELIDTYKKVFAQLPPTQPADPENIDYGAALPVILAGIYGSDEAVLKRAKELFVAIYDSSTFEQTSLYPGVFEALGELHRQGFILHIATNKRMNPVLKILQIKGIFNLFSCIKTSDMSGEKLLSKKTMVEAVCNEFGIRKGWMVGDSIVDLQAGEALGLSTVAALYGYEKKEELLKKNPKFAINQFNEILTYITQS